MAISLNDLESKLQKLEQDYAIARKAKTDELSALDAQMHAIMQEVRDDINGRKDLEAFKADIKTKIANDQFTHEEFESLTPEQQIIVRQALFDFYADDVNVFQALGRIEFSLVYIVKLLAKAIDRTKLTEAELATLDALVGVYGAHPLDPNAPIVSAWEIPFIGEGLNEAVSRRTVYFGKKVVITGSAL